MTTKHPKDMRALLTNILCLDFFVALFHQRLLKVRTNNYGVRPIEVVLCGWFINFYLTLI